MFTDVFSISQERFFSFLLFGNNEFGTYTLLIICFMVIKLRPSNIRLKRHGIATDDEDPTMSRSYSGGLFFGQFFRRTRASNIPESIVTKAPKVLMLNPLHSFT